jgi:hypothetical protein
MEKKTNTKKNNKTTAPIINPEIIEDLVNIKDVLIDDDLELNTKNLDSNELILNTDNVHQLDEIKPSEETDIIILDYINLNYAQLKSLRRTGRLK